MPQLTILNILYSVVLGNIVFLMSLDLVHIRKLYVSFAVQTASMLHKQFEPCLQDQEWQLDKPEN